MYLRILPGVILTIQLAVYSVCENNDTDSKSKRGVYDLGDGIAYETIPPIQQFPTFEKVQALPEEETPLTALKNNPVEAFVDVDSTHFPVLDQGISSLSKAHTFNGPSFRSSQDSVHHTKNFSPESISNSDSPNFKTINGPNTFTAESTVSQNNQQVPVYNDGSRFIAIDKYTNKPIVSGVPKNNEYVPTYTDRPKPFYQINGRYNNNNFQVQPFNPSIQSQNANFQKALRQHHIDRANYQNLPRQNSPQNILRQNNPQNIDIQNIPRQEKINTDQHINIQPQQSDIKQNPAPQNYPVYHPKIENPLHLINNQKSNNRPSLRTSQNSHSFTSIPSNELTRNNVVSQNYPPSTSNTEFNNPLTHQSNQQSTNRNPQFSNIRGKIQVYPVPNPQRPPNPTQRPKIHVPMVYHNPSPIAQITRNFNAIHPGFSESKTFDNSNGNVNPDISLQYQSQNLPQSHHQQNSPPLQNRQVPTQRLQPQRQTQPQKHYTRVPQIQEQKNINPIKPLKSSTIVREHTRIPSTPEVDPNDESDDTSNEEVQEENQSEETPEENQEEDEVSDEEEEKRFEYGYEEAAKGFPQYEGNHYFDYDGRPDDDDSDGRYAHFYPSTYDTENHNDFDEYHEKQQHEYLKDHEYLKNKYFGDHDVQSSKFFDSKEPFDEEEEESAPSNNQENVNKNYKSEPSSQQSSKNPSKLPPKDSHHASSSPKKKSVNHPITENKSKSEPTKEKFKQEIEQIKDSKHESKGIESDSEGHHSAPIETIIRVYKQNWYVESNKN